MNKALALGLATACVIAAALLWFLDHMVPSAVLFVVAVVFDLLFVKALRDERKAKP